MHNTDNTFKRKRYHMAEKATPVTPEEADDIRVTLDLDNGSV